MIDKDFWQEVLQTIRQQKWRSLMTAFGIFWGLLMLMFLIGAGVGFQEGIAGQLKQMPANSIFYASNPTSMAYQGMERSRSWNMLTLSRQSFLVPSSKPSISSICRLPTAH